MARLQKRSTIEQLRELEEQMEELFSSSFPGFPVRETANPSKLQKTHLGGAPNRGFRAGE